MAIRPPNRRSSNQPSVLHVDKFRGLNKSVTPTQIEINESPDMLNMKLDDEGALDKRTGYKKSLPINLGDGKINGFFVCNDKVIVAHGSSLYEFDKSELE